MTVSEGERVSSDSVLFHPRLANVSVTPTGVEDRARYVADGWVSTRPGDQGPRGAVVDDVQDGPEGGPAPVAKKRGRPVKAADSTTESEG